LRRDDELAAVMPLLDRVGDFADLLRPNAADEETFAAIRNSEGSGRPLATADFVADLERRLGRPFARRSPGRKAKETTGDQPQLL
jgi:hypothetical protein